MFSQEPNAFPYDPQLAVTPFTKTLVDKAALKNANTGCEVKWFWIKAMTAKLLLFVAFYSHRISLAFVTAIFKHLCCMCWSFKLQ